MAKVAAPRANKKAQKIAFKVLGIPRNMEIIKKSPKQKELEQRLMVQNTFYVR